MQLLKGKKSSYHRGNCRHWQSDRLLYAEQGADVAIFGTNQERAEQAIKEIEACKADPRAKNHLLSRRCIQVERSGRGGRENFEELGQRSTSSSTMLGLPATIFS